MQIMSEAGDRSVVALVENDSLEEDKASAFDSESTRKEIESLKVETLADLIGICRDKGYQVYNDKPNLPETDRVRVQALREQGGISAQKHRRDDKNSNLLRRSGRNKSRKRSLKSGFDMTSSEAGSGTVSTYSNDETPRKASAVGSVYSQSRDTSRRSSARGTKKFQHGTKDAEEILQQRMRRRWKRRRKSRPGTLAEFMLKMSSQEDKISTRRTSESSGLEPQDSANVSALSTDSHITSPEGSSSHAQDALNENDQFDNDSGNVKRLINERNILESMISPKTNYSNDKNENIKAATDEEETKIDKFDAFGENIDANSNVSKKERVKENDTEKLVQSNTKEKTNKDKTQSRHDEIEIQEEAIDKEGVKDEIDYPNKHASGNNDMEVKQDDNTIQKAPNEGAGTQQTGSSSTHEGKKVVSNMQNVDKDTGMQPKEKKLNEHSEKVIDEVRIKDGKSTLVLYRVNETSLLSLKGTSKDVTWAEKEYSDEKRNTPNEISSKSEEQTQRKPNSEITTREEDINTNFKNSSALQNKDSLGTGRDARKNDYIDNKNRSVSISCLTESPFGSDKRIPSTEVNDKEQLVNNNTDLCETGVKNNGKKSNSNYYVDMSSIKDDVSETTAVIHDNEKYNQQNKEEININEINEKSTNQNNIDDCNNLSLDESSYTDTTTVIRTVQKALKDDRSNLDSDVIGVHGKESSSDMENATDGNTERLEQNEKEYTKMQPNNGTADNENGTWPTQSQDMNVVNCDIGSTKMQDRESEEKDMREETANSLSSQKKLMVDEKSIRSETLLSKDAQFVLIMEKLKQSHEESSRDHLKTIEMFKETRQSLRKEFNTINSDEEEKEANEKEKGVSEIEEICKEEHNTSSEKETVQLKTQNYKQEDIQGDSEKPKSEDPPEMPDESLKETKQEKNNDVVQGQNLSEEKPQGMLDENLNKDSNNSDTFKKDGEEYNADPNGDVIKSIKQNTLKKVDTRWEPGHPMFKKELNKNKPIYSYGNKQAVKALKTSKVDTVGIPEDNVYVKEAKRIYPKGFDHVDATDDKYTTTNKTVKRVIKAKSADIGSTGNAESFAFTVKASENDKPVKRTLKRTVRSSSKMDVIPNKDPLTEKGIVSTETVMNNRQHRHIKSVSSPVIDIDDTIKREQKKKDSKPGIRRATQSNSSLSAENENAIETPNKTNKEGKPRIIIKKKKTKTITKQHDVDLAFLQEYKDITEKAHKDRQDMKFPTSKQNNARRHRKAEAKTSFPKIELESKEHTQISKAIKNNDANQERDDANLFDMDGVSDTNPLVNKYSSKNIPNGLQIGGQSRVSLLSGKSEASISAAVDIVQTRNHFYNDIVTNGDKSVPRKDRVYKLFREIRKIRRNETFTERLTPSIPDTSSDPNTGFLFVNYDRKRRCHSDQRSDIDSFLYESLDYEVCSKVKHISSNHRRRVKALDTMKQKMHVKS